MMSAIKIPKYFIDDLTKHITFEVAKAMSYAIMKISIDQQEKEILVSYGLTIFGGVLGAVPMVVFLLMTHIPDSAWIYACNGCLLMLFIIAGAFGGACIGNQITITMQAKKQRDSRIKNTIPSLTCILKNLTLSPLKKSQQSSITMRTTYQSTYVETPDINLAWVAFRMRLEVTGKTGPDTLYAKRRFVVDDERLLSPEEGRSGGDFDIENNLIQKDKDAAAYRVINDDGQTIGWLFAGLVGA